MADGGAGGGAMACSAQAFMEITGFTEEYELKARSIHCRPSAARVCMMSCAASNVHACTQVGYVDGTRETKALKEWLRPGGALPPAARLVRPCYRRL